MSGQLKVLELCAPETASGSLAAAAACGSRERTTTQSRAEQGLKAYLPLFHSAEENGPSWTNAERRHMRESRRDISTPVAREEMQSRAEIAFNGEANIIRAVQQGKKFDLVCFSGRRFRIRLICTSTSSENT